MSIREITREIASLCDVIYFSGRILRYARGGICTNDEDIFIKMRELVPLYEGFLTYGGMSVREMEALTIGFEETMDEDIINQGPQFIAFMVDEPKILRFFFGRLEPISNWQGKLVQKFKNDFGDNS